MEVIKMEEKDATRLIDEANVVLKNVKNMTITKLYETLVAKGVVSPDTRKDFESLLNYALESGLIQKNKIKRYRSKKQQLADVFNKEQLVKLFDAIDRPKLAIASALAFFCGLRISEVCNLKIEHIDLEKMQLKVVDGKNSRRHLSGYGDDRYVPIPPLMKEPIQKWIDIIQGGIWFLPSLNSPDKHIGPKTLHDEFRHALKIACLLIPKYKLKFKQRINGKIMEKDYTRHKYYFHTLRHSYATYLLSKGVDLYTISGLLGHKQVTTTQVYARMNNVQSQNAVNEAFNMSTQGNASMSVVKVAPQSLTENSNLSPLEYLQMKMIKGEINQEEYVQKLSLLNPDGIKKIIEIKEK
jgi:integrase/recombinase XerD